MIQKRWTCKSAAEAQIDGKGEGAAEESRPGNVWQAQDSPTRSQLRFCAKLGTHIKDMENARFPVVQVFATHMPG